MILRTLLVLALTASTCLAGSLDEARQLIDDGEYAKARPRLRLLFC